MRIQLRTLGCSVGICLALALTASVQAQAPRGGVHRMEIYNGSRLTVRYFANRLSPGETSSLRDLERAENDSIYTASLLELKREYAADERQLEAQRKLLQQQLYGITVTTSAGSWGYGGLDLTAILAGAGRFPALGNYAGLGGNYGGGGYYYGGGAGGILAGLGNTPALSQALATNAVDEGPMKVALAQVIANDSTSAAAASAERALDRAVAVAGGSQTLRTALKLPSPREAYIRPVASDSTGPVTLILNDGKEIKGSRMEETKEWVVVYTRSGKTRVRPTDIKRIDEGGGAGVGPAIDR